MEYVITGWNSKEDSFLSYQLQFSSNKKKVIDVYEEGVNLLLEKQNKNSMRGVQLWKNRRVIYPLIRQYAPEDIEVEKL